MKRQINIKKNRFTPVRPVYLKPQSKPPAIETQHKQYIQNKHSQGDNLQTPVTPH